VFELLGLAPGPDISLPAVESFSGLDTTQTRAVLRELESVHLLQQHAPGRYRMHDLIRLYAAEQARTDRRPALRRVVDFYLHTAYQADRLLDPGPSLDLPGTGLEFPDLAAAMTWFEAEHASLLAAQQLAADHDRHLQAWQLAWVLDNFLLARGHLHDHIRAWRTGLAAVLQLNDDAAHVLSLQRLALACTRAEQHAEAIVHLRHALALVQDDRGRAQTHRILALVCEEIGDHRQALAHATSALELFQTFGDPGLEATGLNLAGWSHARCGDLDRARDHCTRAHQLFRQQDDREGQAAAVDSLGYIALRAGDHAQAVAHCREGVDLCRSIGQTHREAGLLERLGEACAAAGHPGDANLAWQQALDLYRAQHRRTDAVRVERHLRELRAHDAETP
jgi:tetratricopeptide (TPR) repeat protein